MRRRSVVIVDPAGATGHAIDAAELIADIAAEPRHAVHTGDADADVAVDAGQPDVTVDAGQPDGADAADATRASGDPAPWRAGANGCCGLPADLRRRDAV